MSIIRNRELSQFGSFLYIDNTKQNIVTGKQIGRASCRERV